MRTGILHTLILPPAGPQWQPLSPGSTFSLLMGGVEFPNPAPVLVTGRPRTPCTPCTIAEGGPPPPLVGGLWGGSEAKKGFCT